MGNFVQVKQREKSIAKIWFWNFDI